MLDPNLPYQNSGATVTGDIGPGRQVTSQVLTGVTDIDFDINQQTLKITCNQGNPCYDLYTLTTVTYTVSSHVVTLTVTDA